MTFTDNLKDQDNNTNHSHAFIQKLLKLNNVHYKDESSLINLLTKFKLGGIKDLLFISDYDMTLTKHWVNGKRNIGSHSVLAKAGVASENLKKKEDYLLAKYYPYEISNNITYEEKLEKMVEWWSLVHKYYVEENITYSTIRDAVMNFNMVYREGALSLMEKTNEKGIPFLIFSAGLADIIELLLESKGLLKENVQVISNSMIFSEEHPNLLIGFKDPLIHVLNKGEIDLKNHPFYEKVQHRKNIVLLGDSLTDIQMSQSFDSEHVLRIGFLNHSEEINFPKYLDSFDIVISSDSSMDFVNLMLEWLH